MDRKNKYIGIEKEMTRYKCVVPGGKGDVQFCVGVKGSVDVYMDESFENVKKAMDYYGWVVEKLKELDKIINPST